MVLGNSGRGGSQAYVMNVLRNIDRSLFQIDFVFSDDEKGGYGDEMRELGSKTYIIPFYKGYNYKEYSQSWIELLSQNHYDIVHAHATGAAAIYLRIAKRMGCITIAHSHSAAYRGTAFEQWVKKLLAKPVKKYSDYWFACSDKAAERLYGKNYKSYNNYYEIPNAINVEKFLFSENTRLRIRESLHVEDHELLCGHVGTFSVPKNHSFLIDVFELIHRKRPDSKLVLCGEGNLLPEVKAKVESKGLGECVIFTGNVTSVGDYLMAMDVMIFPSIFEGFPVTLVEAQATGLSVVYSDAITKEVQLTDKVVSLSLSEGGEKWATVVLKQDKKDNRTEYNSAIEKTRFNMQNSIKKLSQLYEQMINNQ